MSHNVTILQDLPCLRVWFCPQIWITRSRIFPQAGRLLSLHLCFLVFFFNPHLQIEFYIISSVLVPKSLLPTLELCIVGIESIYWINFNYWNFCLQKFCFGSLRIVLSRPSFSLKTVKYAYLMLWFWWLWYLESLRSWSVACGFFGFHSSLSCGLFVCFCFVLTGSQSGFYRMNISEVLVLSMWI